MALHTEFQKIEEEMKQLKKTTAREAAAKAFENATIKATELVSTAAMEFSIDTTHFLKGIVEGTASLVVAEHTKLSKSEDPFDREVAGKLKDDIRSRFGAFIQPVIT